MHDWFDFSLSCLSFLLFFLFTRTLNIKDIELFILTQHTECVYTVKFIKKIMLIMDFKNICNDSNYKIQLQKSWSYEETRKDLRHISKLIMDMSFITISDNFTNSFRCNEASSYSVRYLRVRRKCIIQPDPSDFGRRLQISPVGVRWFKSYCKPY